MKLNIRANKTLLYAIALSAFCIAVLSARLIYVGQKEYIFLCKNLFLAWMPYAIALLIKRTTEQTVYIKKLLYFILWLLFFPNSAYIITDIYHLDEYKSVPQWFDLLMLLSFSWAGLVWGFMSLQIVQQRFFEKRRVKANIIFIITVFFLTGVGIYLGRYERWNSWDVLFDVHYLYERSYEILQDTETLKYITGMAILYCGVLSFLYYQFFYLKQKAPADYADFRK
ncbi:MAG: DUF1361 domain-containing protein [Fimbriimonadaceae bacterium]|nr:DUF1361 domain-containing protein [Chitinophagales bacterium]